MLVSFLDKIAVSNCPPLLYTDAQELFLQHLFLGCNCFYKHFGERKKKKQCVEIFRTFTVFFFLSKKKKKKTTAQEFEQNQCHDNIRSSEMNMLLVKKKSAEDKLHNNGFSLKIVLKID